MRITAAVSMERDPHGQFVFQELELDETPRQDEIIVKLVAVGICGSDLHGRGSAHPRPIVLGHEGAGVVVRTGSAVSTLEVGDHVLLNYAACGKCRMCGRGMPKLCPHNATLNHSGARADGTTGLSMNSEVVYGQFFGQSSFATHCLANEWQATKLDKSLDLTLAPAFACGIQTGAGAVINGLKPSMGDSMLVIGTGAVGMSALMMARLVGCDEIIAVDVVDNRLELAKELGATHTINATTVSDLEAAVREIFPTGVDFAVEAAGKVDLTQMAMRCLSKGGFCAALGLDMSQQPFSFPHFQLAMTGIGIAGFPGGLVVPDDFVPRLVSHYLQGRFPVDKLVEFYPFEEINAAAFAAETGAAIKPVLLF